MAIDLFEPRTMGRMLLERKSPKGFIRSLFFRNEVPNDTEHIDFDIETRVRLMAPFSSSKLPGQVVDDQGYTTKSFTPPLINPKKVTTAETLQKRLPGENVYSQQSPDERAAALLGKNLGELEDMIIRREEWMCMQAAFLGQVPVVGPGVNVTIDFGRNAGNTVGLLAASERWSAGTADIPKNLRDWNRTMVQRCGVGADVAILGQAAADALLNNSALRGQLETLRMDMGQIAPEYMEAKGVTYLGRLKGTAIDLWSYDEWYIDPNNPGAGEQAMMSSKFVLVGSTRAQTELAYGSVPVATGTDGGASISLVSGQRVPESWIEKEPAARFIKVSARPLPIPTQVNAFLTAQVVA